MELSNTKFLSFFQVISRILLEKNVNASPKRICLSTMCLLFNCGYTYQRKKYVPVEKENVFFPFERIVSNLEFQPIIARNQNSI